MRGVIKNVENIVIKSVEEQLPIYTINLERLMAGHALNLERLMAGHALNQERLMAGLALNLEKELSKLHSRFFFSVSPTPSIVYLILTRLSFLVFQWCL